MAPRMKGYVISIGKDCMASPTEKNFFDFFQVKGVIEY